MNDVSWSRSYFVILLLSMGFVPGGAYVAAMTTQSTAYRDEGNALGDEPQAARDTGVRAAGLWRHRRNNGRKPAKHHRHVDQEKSIVRDHRFNPVVCGIARLLPLSSIRLSCSLLVYYLAIVSMMRADCVGKLLGNLSALALRVAAIVVYTGPSRSTYLTHIPGGIQ